MDLNLTKFYIDKSPFNGISWKASNHRKPETFPSFVFALDKWNDFNTQTQFDVFFYEDSFKCEHFGQIKIIKRDFEESYCVADYLNSNLSEDFVSLGQNASYYESFYNTFGTECAILLKKLRDCSINSLLQEEFETNRWWNSSLIRTNDAERMLREAANIILGKKENDISELYMFKYRYTPPYTKEYVEFSFDFYVTNKYFP